MPSLSLTAAADQKIRSDRHLFAQIYDPLPTPVLFYVLGVYDETPDGRQVILGPHCVLEFKERLTLAVDEFPEIAQRRRSLVDRAGFSL